MTSLAQWHPTRAGTNGTRSYALDGFRGLAILAMMVDHLVLVTDGPIDLRIFPGRVAMPMFFILAGHLASAPRWRHLGIAGLGVALPLLVPWVDAPNVLVLWAIGALLIWGLRQLRVPLWAVPVVALTVAANGFGLDFSGFEVTSTLALMACGALVPRTSFGWAARCPGWVAALGRHPVAWYVGHVLVLQGVVVAVGTR